MEKNGKLRRYISKRGLLWKCRKDVVGRIIYEAVKILIRRVYPGRIGSFVKGVATEGNAVVINFITTNFPHGTFVIDEENRYALVNKNCYTVTATIVRCSVSCRMYII